MRFIFRSIRLPSLIEKTNKKVGVEIYKKHVYLLCVISFMSPAGRTDLCRSGCISFKYVTPTLNTLLKFGLIETGPPGRSGGTRWVLTTKGAHYLDVLENKLRVYKVPRKWTKNMLMK
jgi:hypothetical protein